MTDKSKHTPGMICIQPGTPAWIESNDGKLMAKTVVKSRGGEQRANADRLVACWNALEGWADPSAAGELLEAMIETFQYGNVANQSQAAANLKAAIAKAKGVRKKSGVERDVEDG